MIHTTAVVQGRPAPFYGILIEEGQALKLYHLRNNLSCAYNVTDHGLQVCNNLVLIVILFRQLLHKQPDIILSLPQERFYKIQLVMC